MPDEAADNTAPMSQDDIDAMLSGAPLGSGDPLQADDAGSGGPSSQKGVDTARTGDQAPSKGPVGQNDSGAAPAGADADGTPDADQAGILDQDEMDAMLGGGVGGEAMRDELGDSLSQADIDAALSGAGIATDLPEVPATPGRRPSAQAPHTLSGNVVQGGNLQSFELPDLQAAQAAALANVASIEMLRDVELNVKIELGRSRMLVEDVLKLDAGAVVELDKLAGDPVEVFVNEQLVARGEVLVLNDNFCVRINEIVAPLSEMKTA